VLVDVVAMLGVTVTIVHIVDMVVMLDSLMTTVGTVDVGVFLMNGAGGGHKFVTFRNRGCWSFKV